MLGPLLGYETRAPGLPCAISVPNLMTDRSNWLAEPGAGLNVRRLMYQSLIWSTVLGDHARRLGPPFHSKRLQRVADSLVYCVGRDAKLDGDLLGREVLVDQSQAIELAGGQPAHSLGDLMIQVDLPYPVGAGHACAPELL